MPVRATTTVDIREEIALMALSGAYTISELAELFEITRPTIYKYRERYRVGGRSGLVDQRRAPKHPRRTPDAMVRRIVAERRRWGWGSKKIRRRLLDAEPERAWPARSTIDEIFKRHQLVVPRRRPLRIRSPFRQSYTATEPGELTSIDFKGEFRLGNRRWCHPLTIVDSTSRYLLACHALDSIALNGVWPVFERVLREHGLPAAVLSDNGPPFGGHGLTRWSTFSVRLMKLDIQPVLIDPGHPEQNAAHERMHRSLKDGATLRPGRDLSHQQRIFNLFRRTYNHERPHEGIGLARPARCYSGSPRPFPSRPPLIEYPSSFEVRTVSSCGTIKWRHHPLFISHSFSGERLGFELCDDRTWTVHFASFVIGKFNEHERRFL